MVALTPSFIALALFCTAALALPQNRPDPRPYTHHSRQLKNGNQVQSYHPEPVFETFGAGVENQFAKVANFREAGIAYLKSRLGEKNKFALKSSTQGGDVSHVYVSQTINDLPVANAVANVALKGGRVVSYGSTFVSPKKVADPTPKLSLAEAQAKALEFLGGKLYESGAEPKLEYYALDSGEVALAHAFQVELENDTFLEAYVDATSGEVLGVVDFTSHLTVTVVPISEQSPLDGIKTIVDPEDPIASPAGWETLAGAQTNVTRGNNIWAYKGTSANATKETSANTYAYVFDPTQEPTVAVNVNAATVNAWYVANSVHDITYRYGFTEAAFNFQSDNFGKGGKAGDYVTLSVQDASGTNNANMATFADGQVSAIRMYRFTRTTPNRDGDLQNDIVIHEYTHGITNRMTGGGTAACLQTTESRGMGEGWSDALSNWMGQVSGKAEDWATGTWVLNSTAGVRDYIYSTDLAKNPLMYANLATRTQVHAAGVVWANLLHNVFAALLTQHGYAADAKTNPNGTAGNQIWLHLFLDALQLQPCNPTFLQARAAWVQADANRYGGANKCLLWKVFASRGFGTNATSAKVNNFDVPAECA